jgi:hypothetical protein
MTQYLMSVIHGLGDQGDLPDEKVPASFRPTDAPHTVVRESGHRAFAACLRSVEVRALQRA